jgi:hypothetical protein
MKISMNKKYRLRDNTYEYVMLDDCIDSCSRSVLGKYRLEGNPWRVITHYPNGKHLRYTSSQYDLIEVTPYDHIKKGDKVIVWDNNSKFKSKFRGYFSGVDVLGRPRSYINGATEWSSDGETHAWDNCILAEDDNNNEE